MKSLHRISWIFALALLFSCGGSKDPLPEEEEQVEPPVAATLIFPENNTECQEGTVINDFQSRVNFRWNASEHTDSYEVHLKNIDEGTNTMYQSTANEMEILLERGTAYSWSVVSKSDASDETSESETWKFYNAGAAVVNHAPFPADLLSPLNNEILAVGSGNILLQWEASDIDDDIVLHEVFFGLDNPPSNSIGTTTDNEMNATVAANTTYFWYIRTEDSAGNFSQSDVFSFTTE